MAKPTLTQAAFLAALSTLACSRSTERMSAEPAKNAAPPAMPAAAATAAPAPENAQATAGANASAAAIADPSPPSRTIANKPVGSGTELKQGRGVKPRASNEPGGQMTCSANGCSPDMKKNTQ